MFLHTSMNILRTCIFDNKSLIMLQTNQKDKND